MKCARRRGEDELQWTRGRQIGMADQRPERKKEQETTKLQAGLILVTCELLPWHLFINRRKVYGKVWKQQHQLCTCSGLFVAKGRIKQMQKANSHRLFLNSSANIQHTLVNQSEEEINVQNRKTDQLRWIPPSLPQLPIESISTLKQCWCPLITLINRNPNYDKNQKITFGCGGNFPIVICDDILNRGTAATLAQTSGCDKQLISSDNEGKQQQQHRFVIPHFDWFLVTPTHTDTRTLRWDWRFPATI